MLSDDELFDKCRSNSRFINAKMLYIVFIIISFSIYSTAKVVKQ